MRQRRIFAPTLIPDEVRAAIMRPLPSYITEQIRRVAVAYRVPRNLHIARRVAPCSGGHGVYQHPRIGLHVPHESTVDPLSPGSGSETTPIRELARRTGRSLKLVRQIVRGGWRRRVPLPAKHA